MASNGAKALAALGTVGGGSAATGLVLTYNSETGELINDTSTNKETSEENTSSNPDLNKEKPEISLENNPLINLDAENIPNLEQEEAASVPQVYKYKTWANKHLKNYIPGVSWSPTDKNLGSDYGLFLIDPDDDKPQWDKHFAALSKVKNDPSKVAGEFKNVLDATTSTNKKALSRLCKDFYKKTYVEAFPSTEVDKKEILIKNFWEFCSYLGEEPKSTPKRVTSNPSGQEKYIDELFYSLLPDASDNKNNIFWEIKEEWYSKLTEENRPYKDNFDSYVKSKEETIKDQDKVSIRKFCFESSKELIKGGTVKPITVLTYCSHWNYDYTDYFESNGEDIKSKK